MENPREDGESLLDWDGNDDSSNIARINVSLCSYPTPTSFVSVYNDERPVPTNDGDDETSHAALEIDEFAQEWNPNEAIVPPCDSAVPSTRLSNFRCGVPVDEYPIPNAAKGLSNPGIARFSGRIQDVLNILNARAFRIFRMAVRTLSGYPASTRSGHGPS